MLRLYNVVYACTYVCCIIWVYMQVYICVCLCCIINVDMHVFECVCMCVCIMCMYQGMLTGLSVKDISSLLSFEFVFSL